MGRPRTVSAEITTGLRLPRLLSESIDSWIAAQPGSRVTRSEGIRELIRLGLKTCGVDVPETRPVRTTDERIARAKKRASKPAPAGPASPEKGLAMLKRGTAEAALAGLKAKRKPRAP
jgi:Arc/MetJ-type ribon-helix-helix transcriptional regulator